MIEPAAAAEEGEVVALLPFGVSEAPASEGMLALFADRTVRLVPSEHTRAEFATFTGGLDHKALAWGASLLVGLAALGGFFWYRGRRNGAWTLFGLAGMAGVGGAWVRSEAGKLGDSLTLRHRLGETASVTRTRSGGIAFQVREPGLPPWSVVLAPDEFESAQAEAFLQAVNAAVASAV